MHAPPCTLNSACKLPPALRRRVLSATSYTSSLRGGAAANSRALRLQVVHRGRFIRRTLDFARARAQGTCLAADSGQRVLGYMVTSFNSMTKETSNALEMTLDWFHSFSRVTCLPDALLAKLLAGALGAVATRVYSSVELLCSCVHACSGMLLY